jgi:hypothetical protein
VAPVFMENQNKGGHEWVIEFEKKPEDPALFEKLLDERLRCLNTDYDAKRYKDMALMPLKMNVVPTNTFNLWLKHKGKLGGQSKIPRLANDRKYITELMDFIKNVN